MVHAGHASGVSCIMCVSRRHAGARLGSGSKQRCQNLRLPVPSRGHGCRRHQSNRPDPCPIGPREHRHEPRPTVSTRCCTARHLRCASRTLRSRCRVWKGLWTDVALIEVTRGAHSTGQPTAKRQAAGTRQRGKILRSLWAMAAPDTPGPIKLNRHLEPDIKCKTGPGSTRKAR